MHLPYIKDANSESSRPVQKTKDDLGIIFPGIYFPVSSMCNHLPRGQYASEVLAIRWTGLARDAKQPLVKPHKAKALYSPEQVID